MRLFFKWLMAVAFLLSSFLTSTYYLGIPTYESPKTFQIPSDFAKFADEKISLSLSKGARKGNEEKYVPQKNSPFAILYIHGFGASRAEGEYVVDELAQRFGASVYYVRLPGHGTNVEDHLVTPYTEYLKAAEEALFAIQATHERVVVVGTSMGGMLSTYLASKYPEKVTGLVLASPFYGFADPSSFLYNFTWGDTFVDIVMGKIRKSKELDPEDDSYSFWYRDQYYAALRNLMQLKRFFFSEERFSKVKAPVLMLVYYKSETEQDFSASVPEMIHAFEAMNSKSSNSKLVKISDGAHVLFSKYIKTDKELISKEMTQFLEEVTGVKAKASQKSKSQ